AFVEATRLGKVTLEGLGGLGTDINSGVYVEGSGTVVKSADGALSITGTGQGHGTDNQGIEVVGAGVVEATGRGAVTLTGHAPGAPPAITFVSGNGSGSLQAGTGDVTLSGDVIDLGDPGSISGSGQLFLQPHTPSRPIQLGGTSDAPGYLTIKSADVAAIAP